MNVVELKDLKRKQLAVDYRRAYRGVAVLAIAGNHTLSSEIEFSLELTPMVTNDVTVDFLKTPDFPIVPAIRVLKSFISSLDAAGELP